MKQIIKIAFSFLLINSIGLFAQDFTEGFLTQNILQRVLLIKSDLGTGSSFVIEKYDRSFLLTAKHIFPNLKENEIINFQVLQNKKWVDISGIAHLSSNSNADVIVIDLREQLFGNNSTDYLNTKGQIPLGSEGFFLGFPMSLKTEMNPKENNGLPIPLVKKIIVSGFLDQNGVNIPVLDGNNTPGFSGGPVFIKSYNKGKVVWYLLGLISGYYPQNNIAKTNQGDFTYNENSGIILCGHILYIREIMEKIKN